MRKINKALKYEVDEQDALIKLITNKLVMEVKKLEQGERIYLKELLGKITADMPEVEKNTRLLEKVRWSTIRMLQAQGMITFNEDGSYRKDEKGNIAAREDAVKKREKAKKIVRKIMAETGATKRTEIFAYLREKNYRDYETYKATISCLCQTEEFPGLIFDTEVIDRKAFFNKRASTSLERDEEI